MTTPFQPLEPRGPVLGEEVYAQLGEAIIDGRLPAGERLRDHELAERLGVSRTPVREALLRLERTGLVEIAPNRYTRVSQINDGAQADVREFFVYLMGNALRIGLRRCSDDELAHLLEHADAVVAASRSNEHDRLLEATSLLFEHVIDHTANRAFRRVMREAEIAIRRNLAGWRPHLECPVTRTAAYEQFRDAVAARDGSTAETILRELHGLD